MIQKTNGKTELEIINERLSEKKPDYMAYYIRCDLENDFSIILDDEKEQEIAFYLKNENIIKEGVDIALKITETVLEDAILFRHDKEEVYKRISEKIKKQDKIYLGYKKYWQRQKDLLSPIFEVKELAELEGQLISVKVTSYIDRDFIKRDVRESAIKSLMKCYQDGLIEMGLKTLF